MITARPRFFVVLLLLASTPWTPATADAIATRGITGRVVVVDDGPRLRPRSDLDLASPLLVRVAAARTGADGRTTYEFEFIGSIAGAFDLRDVLERVDGSPLGNLDPIPIEVVSRLPDHSSTDVFTMSGSFDAMHAGYRRALIAIAVAWIAIPVFVVLRRVLTRPPATVEVETPRPSLADQLEPLVVAASRRSLTVAEQGRLELLLYAYWGEQIGLGAESRAASIARLRVHEEAGRLLRTVESWLHRPNAAVLAPGDVGALLAPYRLVPAISEGASS
ncbi:MAG: hypothetical protein KDA25_02325 [Phycisphaerales bacterium]|nr:hypothetical protein [Phycisphaerales bacterium]